MLTTHQLTKKLMFGAFALRQSQVRVNPSIQMKGKGSKSQLFVIFVRPLVIIIRYEFC